MSSPVVSIVVTARRSPMEPAPSVEPFATRPRNLELIVVDTTAEGWADTPAIDADVVLNLDTGSPRSMARNIGASCASGDIVTFIDADDRWTIEALEGTVRSLAEQPALAGVLLSGRETSTGQSQMLTMRAATLLRVGGFDPDLASGEIDDLLARCQRSGNRIGRLSERPADLVVADAAEEVTDHDRPSLEPGPIRPAPTPTVSVVVPVYNAAPYLRESLESVLAQDLEDIEIVVVDDASTDDSLAVATQLAAERPNVRVAPHPGGGPGAARNLGLLLARGRFIAMQDADDVWLPGKLAEQLAVLDARPELDVVFGRVEEFVSPELPPEEAKRFHPRQAASAHANSALLARRAAMARVGLHRRGRTGGDYPNWYIRAVQAGLSMGTVERVVVRRRLHRSNQSHRLDTIRTQYFELLRGAIAARRQHQ